MSQNETKQMILDTALRLFSQFGYSAVSIRDICGEVGIKESSIYYHFKNKQAILDALIEEFRSVSDSMPQPLDTELHAGPTITDEDFKRITRLYVHQYLLNEKIIQFVKTLMIEQHSNPDIAALYHELFFDRPLSTQAALLEQLIKSGYLKAASPYKLALAYYAPILFLYLRHCVSGGEVQGERSRVDGLLEEHMQTFLNQYKHQEGFE